jgi:hypothetical protein
MNACPHCAAPVDEGGACARCDARPGRAPRGFRFALLGLAVGVLSAAVVPGVLRRATGGAGTCEPQSWVDWHVAMKRACLTPAYVCHNMTSSKLLEDPQLAKEFRAALEAGDPEPLASLDDLVGRMRASYGCGDPQEAPRASPFQGPAAPRLPPGHPPIGGGPGRAPSLPTFDRRPALEI